MVTLVPCLLMVPGRSRMAWLCNDIYLNLSTGLVIGAQVLRSAIRRTTPQLAGQSER